MFPPICIKVYRRNDYEPVITKNDKKTDKIQLVVTRNDTKPDYVKLGYAAYFAAEEVQTNMKKEVTLFCNNNLHKILYDFF